MAGQACGVLPFLRALRTDPRRVEGIPPAQASGVAIPAVVLARLPPAARTADPAIVAIETGRVRAWREPPDHETEAAEQEEEVDHHDVTIASSDDGITASVSARAAG